MAHELRYAVILKATGQIVDIKPVSPTIKDNAEMYEIASIESGVQIGMYRNGPQRPIHGWGYPPGLDLAARIGNDMPKPPAYTTNKPKPAPEPIRAEMPAKKQPMKAWGKR